MKRIITTHYRYKRPPKKKKAVALTMPAVATIPGKHVAKGPNIAATKVAAPAAKEPKSSIVTVRRPRARWHTEVPDLTEEEINRRADDAEALFREIRRRSGLKDQQ